MNAVSFSALPLLGKCQYFARSDVTRRVDESNDDQRMGNAGHRCMELEIAGDFYAFDDIADEFAVSRADRAELELAVEEGRRFIAANRMPDWRAEVAYAINFATGHAKRLKPEYHRDYRTCPPGYTPGTLDVVWEPIPGVRVAVPDWKFGFGGHVGDARENLQLAAQACAAASAHGCDEALIVIAHVRAEGVELSEVLFSREQLEEARRLIVRLFDAIPSAEPKPGPHCYERWCAALVGCPATQTLVAPLALVRPGLAKAMRLTLDPQTKEQASALVDFRGILKAYDNAIAETLHSFVDQHGPIPRPSGKDYRRTEQETETADLSVPGAFEQLAALGLADKVKRSVSWKELGRSAPEAREQLRAVGAIKKGKRVIYDE